MKRKKYAVIPLIFLIILLLLLCNRDLFHFEFSFLGQKQFDPAVEGKGTYILSDPFVLKPGVYSLIFSGSVPGRGSSVILVRGEDEVYTGYDLEEGSEEQSLAFTVAGSAENLRIGVDYDPASSSVYVKKISVVSDHVLYKSSLLRHGTISLFILLCGLLLLVRIMAPERFSRLFPVFGVKQNEADFFLLILLSLVLSYPLLLPDSYGLAEDMFFHVSRIEGIAKGIQAGYFPVRNELFWLKNYGYGTGYFYPDLFLYIPAALRLLGFSVLTCYKIFTVLCTFLSLVSFYVAAGIIGKSRMAGLAAAVIFGFSAYRCFAVFYRGAAGEVQAFIFFPLIVLGIYYLFNGKPERWWVFSLGFWGLLSCHLISLVLAGCLTAVYFLLKIRTILRDRKIFSGILKAFLLAVFLGAGFWLPMLQQMRGNSLNMNILVSGKSGGLQANNVNPVKNLLIFFHDWSYDKHYFRSVYPGWILLAVPFLRIFLYFRKVRISKAADFMLAAGILLMICSTDLFPWKYLIWFLNRIQFTWRLLSPATVLLSVCGGIYAAEIGRPPFRWACLAVLTAACAACAFPICQDTILNRTYPEDRFIMQDNRVAGMEYMPIGLRAEFIDKNRDTVASLPEDVEILSHKRRGLTFSFSFAYSGDEPSLTFVVPLIRYYGYRGTFTPENGDPMPIDVGRSENGLVSVRVPAVNSGSILVSFHKTGFEIVGEILSLLTLFAGFFCIFRKRRAVRIS